MSREKFTKLPNIIRPYEYELSICLKETTFIGRVKIKLEILKAVECILLHSSDLEIENVYLTLSDGKELELEHDAIKLNKPCSLLTIALPQQIDAQNGVILDIIYKGKINDILEGFSRSMYMDSETSEPKYIFYTQFASTHARMAFPCFDEPVYKARFNVTLQVSKEFTALSNMPVLKEELVDGDEGPIKCVKFATSPPMSTYLLAFVVGKLEYIETFSQSGIPIRIYTVPGKRDLGSYSLQLAAKAIDWYGNWFDFPTPIPKYDIVAIPDMIFGAMENWGLVTFKELRILFDPYKSSKSEKLAIAFTVAHETSHFWFGNLVTMKWWTDMWLNEGFASFMQYLFVARNCPEFGDSVWSEFLQNEVVNGFKLDSLRSSHPIEIAIDDPKDLDEFYDAITYQKANSVIRMLCEFLGEETFRAGIVDYIRKFQFGNAETRDLWETLSNTTAAKYDIAEMMSTWTKQMGFPLIHVIERKQLDQENCVLRLKQERFLGNCQTDYETLSWTIPIVLEKIGEENRNSHQFLLKEREERITLNGIKYTDKIKLNYNTTGFYRVRYSDEIFTSLVQFLNVNNTLRLGVLDRFGLVSDTFALAASGRIQLTDFFRMLSECRGERDLVVWQTLDDCFATLLNVIDYADSKEIRTKFSSIIVNILEPIALELGWDEQEQEDSKTTRLRALVLNRLASIGHQPTVEKALKLFSDFIDGRGTLRPDLRSTIFSTAAKSVTKGKEHISQLKHLLQTANFSEIELQCVFALGSVTEPEFLEKIYQFAFSENVIRSQYLPNLFFGTSSSSRRGKDFAWYSFKLYTPNLLEKFGSAKSVLFQRCLEAATKTNCEETVATDIRAYFSESFGGGLAEDINRKLEQIIEQISINGKLLTNVLPSLESCIEQFEF